MSAVTTFRERLADRLEERRLRVATWRGGSRASSHLLEVDTKPKRMVFYVKESHSARGFWGLTKNQVDHLNDASVRWFAVLLARSSDVGYLLSGDQVNASIQDGTFELSRDGDHKVNEVTDLDESRAFHGIEDLIDKVI